MAGKLTAEAQREKRLQMVNSQLRTGDIVDQSVLAAFLETPREAFVAPQVVNFAYLDRDAPALGATTRRMLAPLILAKLLQAAVVSPGDKALDVGGGAGYGAAILDAMGARVTALESDPGAAAAAHAALAGRAGVTVVEGDLAAGAPSAAPFDVIVLHGAFEIEPEALIAQLADGGRMVGVDATSRAPQAVLIEKKGGAVSRRALFEPRVETLDGLRKAPAFAF